MKAATLDPLRGYANALRGELSEAVPVLDAFRACQEVCVSEPGHMG